MFFHGPVEASELKDQIRILKVARVVPGTVERNRESVFKIVSRVARGIISEQKDGHFFKCTVICQVVPGHDIAQQDRVVINFKGVPFKLRILKLKQLGKASLIEIEPEKLVEFGSVPGLFRLGINSELIKM